jgi:hypothetical protein
MDFEGFYETFQHHWHQTSICINFAQDLTARLKSLRYGLKKWSRNLSQLNKMIATCNYVLALLDGLEDQRILSTQDFFS